MSYQVFARKYRPQVFDDVLGQDHVVQTLKNAVLQRRLAHAYLFVGPRGTGKTSTARILAKGLNCVNGPTVNPCGVCDSCREISQGISLDVLEIDGASNNSVDQIRELRDNVRFAPVRGRYKVYIIDEVHMLTQQAFNALLKTLEEPPDHVIFVFATTEVHRVLPTILSRCQRFDLRRIPTQVIARHLAYIAGQEQVTLSRAAAEAIATAADGGLRDAESMLDQLVAFCGDDVGEEQVLEVFGLTSERVVIDTLSAIIDRNAAEALALIDRQADAGKDLGRLLTDLLVFARTLLVFKVDPAALREEVSDVARAGLERLHGRIETAELLRLIQQLADTESVLKWSANKRLHLEIGAIRAVQGLEEIGLESVLDALQGLRTSGQTTSGVKTTPARTKAPRTAVAPKGESQPPPATANLTNRPSAGVKPEPVAPTTSADPGTIASASREPAPSTGDPMAGRKSERPGGERPDGSQVPNVPTASDLNQVAPPPPGAPDLHEVWRGLLAEVRSKRPLILSWLEQAVPLEVGNGVLRLGFPEEQAIAHDSLMRANNRQFVEAMLSERLGGTYRLEGQVRPGLQLPPDVRPVEVDANEAFKNDPLIQKALDLFRAEIQSAEPR